ncbi:MAG: hypothetical protein ABI806_25310 [Candidatus Solibacter sp.]
MAKRAVRWDGWNPPDGLGYSSLRPVRLTGAGRALQVGAAAMVLVGIAAWFFMSLASQREKTEARLMAEQGARTNAEITRVWRTGGNAKNRNAEARNRLSYTFQHAGQHYSRSLQVPYKIWQNLKAGQSLEVRYVAERPEISQPVEWGGRPMAPWAAYLVGGLLMMIAPLFLLPLRRQYLLLAEGKPAPGRIVEMQKTDETVLMKFEFRLLNGATARGKVQLGEAPKEPFCVLYEPDNPRRWALYPMSLVKLDK